MKTTEPERNDHVHTALRRVIISGGGTGGHIFPALSIADEIRRRNPEAEIRFVGAAGRMEMERVPAAGYPIEGLTIAGLDRRRLWRNFRVLWLAWKATRRCRAIVRDFRPDVAIGVGGYASGPLLKAAQRAGIPTILQEQNSYAGVTNKLLGKRARAICVAYDGMQRFFPGDRIILTGNPVRAALRECALSPEQARQALGFDPERPLVLVVGGSLGARTINRALAANAAQAIAAAGAQILWQTGKTYAPDADTRLPDGVRATTFVTDMATAYRAADIVVSRAGASTISELQLLGKAAVLVPSPNVAENHQYHNAMALVKRDAAVLVADADAERDLAGAVCDLLRNPERRATLAANAADMGRPDSTADIVDIIEDTVAKTRQ